MIGAAKLDRYVMRTFATSYLPLAGAFLIVYLVADGFTRLDRFVQSGGPLLETAAAFYAGTLPIIFLRFGPFLTVAAGMFAVARLQRGNELMPMLAGGVRVQRAVAPLFLCAAGMALLTAADAEVLIPRIAPMIRRATQYQRQNDLRPGILRDRAGNTLALGLYRPAVREARWITFRIRDREGRVQSVVYAERGRWVEAPQERHGGHWLLEDGVVRDEVPPTATASAASDGAPRVEQRTFGRGAEEGLAIETSVVPIDVESLTEAVSLLSFDELREQYRRQRYLPKLRVQLHERFTGPLAHLLLLLLGLPFVLRPESRDSAGLFLGALALVGICALYFVASFASGAMGAQGSVEPFLAAWMPPVAFGLIGIWAFDRVRT